ncbi:MAG: hypothetical protein GTO41_11640 [Burkholderiales bacterium]|nr:hypothetical protein [Burkholderiales bacterium]
MIRFCSNVSNLTLCVLGIVILFVALSWFRDTGYAGPHHDEVIALMAAKGLHLDYANRALYGEKPFNAITLASEWHKYTRDFKPVPFREVRQSVQARDKHPPLAFWVLNRWLSLFPGATYGHAVWLMQALVLLSGGLLAVLIYRCTGSACSGALGFGLFLFGNSAISLGGWVRQYALWLLCYSAVLLLAFELSRPALRPGKFILFAAALALSVAAGMMSQYAFFTVSLPVLAALFWVTVRRRARLHALVLVGAYLIAAALFFLLNPGAIRHVLVTAEAIARPAQWLAAVGGLSHMVIPLPSALPRLVSGTAGAAVMIMAFALATAASLSQTQSESDQVATRVVLSGMLGAGALQVGLVGLGYFPGWATGPVHMAPFWLLSVFSFMVMLRRIGHVGRTAIPVVAMALMIGMQLVYGAHTHRIRPYTNVTYVSRLQPDLVYIDNPARGMVLQLTDMMPPQQRVLVADLEALKQIMAKPGLQAEKRILYLMMGGDADVTSRVDETLAAVRASGWAVYDLPVVHPGLYDAYLFEAG